MTKSISKTNRIEKEEMEVAGSDLVETVKNLIKEGNVRRLIVKKPEGDVLIEIPLTAGVAIGGAMVVFAPVLAALGALAALLVKVTIEVVRENAEDSSEDS